MLGFLVGVRLRVKVRDAQGSKEKVRVRNVLEAVIQAVQLKEMTRSRRQSSPLQ